MDIVSESLVLAVSHLSGGNYTNPAASQYGYRPSIPVNSIYLALFLIAGVAAVAKTVQYRAWWMIPLWIGIICEVIGYSARLYAASTIPRLFMKNPFLIQIVLLVIAPALFAAVNYTVLGFLVERGGRMCSVLGGRHFLFTVIFVTCDVISLIIQSVGGAMASIAEDQGKNTVPGTHVMVSGIAFQTVTMSVFILLFIEYIIKTLRRPKWWTPREWKVLVVTLFGSSLCILVRSIYRVIELFQGWRGYLITREAFFLVLDGLLMLIFVYSHLIVFPTPYLRTLRRESDELDEKANGANP